MSESPAPTSPTEPPPFELDEPFHLTVTGDQDDQDRAREDQDGRTRVRRPRSRTRTIVLAALLVVALAGGGTLGYAGWQMSSQKDATLTTPDQIGALKLDNSDDGQQTAEYLQTALDAEIDLHASVGAVYTDTPSHSVLFFGGTGTIWSPDKTLKNAFDLIADEQGSVTGLHKVDAGPLGGTMQCGTTKSDNTDLSVCGWSDHGCLALAMFPNRTEQEAAPLLRQIRKATQSRH
jgi:hypothetical protein